MRVAFLIMAHQYPHLLDRLVGRLADPDASFTIHVNAEVAEAPFRECLAPHANVDFMPPGERFAVRWAGLSFTRATFAALRHAHRTDAERFVLLSGQDYPTWSAAHILAHVRADAELMTVDRQCLPGGTGWFDRCAYEVSLNDFAACNPYSGWPPLVRLVRQVTRRLPRRRYPLPIYYGSTWWSLTRAGADAVLGAVEADPCLLDWFAYTLAPDEMFYQTMLMNSGRREFIRFDDTRPDPVPRPARTAALHYLDFEGPHPRTLDLTDLPAIRASGAAFVRKVHPEQSADLMDRLDACADAVGATVA